MASTVTRKKRVVEKCAHRGRPEKPIMVDAAEQLDLLAVVDDAIKVFALTHNRLLVARRRTVASIASRERSVA